MKRCKICCEDLREKHFNRNTAAPDGLRLECRVCQSKLEQERYLKTRVLKGKPSSRAHDLSGMAFGRLKVICRVENDRQGKPQWSCWCECGTEGVVVRAATLKAGHQKSCGCLAKEVGRRVWAETRARNAGRFHQVRPPGEAARLDVVRSYVRGAKTRNLAWELSDSEVTALLLGDCFYCGIPPKQTRKHERSNGQFIYNGIDRKNNTLGYNSDNCVSCCKSCNIAKGARGVDEFIEWAERVVSNRRRTWTKSA